MNRVRSALVAALVAALAVPGVAGAASWERPVEKGSVRARDLDREHARGPIRDRVLEGPLARPASHEPTRIERFRDAQGRSILIGTSIAGIDLSPFAEVLAGTLHGDELSELRVLVVRRNEVGPHCGGPADVVACYGPDDPDTLPSGLMIVPNQSADLVHALVHEYGHHMDNQLPNLAHLGLCSFDSDGSRRWYFARDRQSDVRHTAGCTDDVPYERLLFELYAEDYVALNGIDDWFTVDFPPPSARVRRELRKDIVDRFYPEVRRYRARLGGWRTKTRRYFLKTPVYFEARLRGPRGVRANLNLALYRKGRSRPTARSVHRGSRERIHRLLGRGTWYLKVRARRVGGRYRLAVELF